MASWAGLAIAGCIRVFFLIDPIKVNATEGMDLDDPKKIDDPKSSTIQNDFQLAVGTLPFQKSSATPPSSNFDDHVVSVVVFVTQYLLQLFISKMGDYRGEADESR